MQCLQLNNIISYNRLKILFVQIILPEIEPESSKFILSAKMGIKKGQTQRHHYSMGPVGGRFRKLDERLLMLHDLEL